MLHLFRKTYSYPDNHTADTALDRNLISGLRKNSRASRVIPSWYFFLASPGYCGSASHMRSSAFSLYENTEFFHSYCYWSGRKRSRHCTEQRRSGSLLALLPDASRNECQQIRKYHVRWNAAVFYFCMPVYCYIQRRICMGNETSGYPCLNKSFPPGHTMKLPLPEAIWEIFWPD